MTPEPNKRRITLRDLAQLVRDTRQAQRSFFRHHSPLALSQAKALEQRLDALVTEILDEQLKLF